LRAARWSRTSTEQATRERARVAVTLATDGRTLNPPVSDADPQDWAAARRSYSAEQRLLVGILERALADTRDVDSAVAVAARAWLFGEALPGEGWAFEDVALALNIDPNGLRKLATETASPRTRRAHVYSTNTPRPTVPREVHEDLVAVADVAAA
jgi:hypothetical protein